MLAKYTIEQIIEEVKSMYPDKDVSFVNLEMEKGKSDLYVNIGGEEKVFDASASEEKVTLTEIAVEPEVTPENIVETPGEVPQNDAPVSEEPIAPEETPAPVAPVQEDTTEKAKSILAEINLKYDECKQIYEEMKSMKAEIETINTPPEPNNGEVAPKNSEPETIDEPTPQDTTEKSKAVRLPFGEYSPEDVAKYFPSFLNHDLITIN